MSDPLYQLWYLDYNIVSRFDVPLDKRKTIRLWKFHFWFQDPTWSQ